MHVDWDEAVYLVITAIVLAFIAWLIFMPAPGHDPLVQFVHAARAA